MDKEQRISTGGLGVAWILTIVFIILKLCHVITWSWVWVLAPLWIEAILAIIVLSVLIAVLKKDNML